MKYTWILSGLLVLMPCVAQAQDTPDPAQAEATPLFPERMGPSEADSAPVDPSDAPIAANPGQVAPGEVDTGTQQWQQLANHRWTLTAASDAQAQPLATLFPAAGRPYQFAFSATGLSVQGPCNALAGAFQVNAEGLLEIPPLRATMMACEPELMAADTALAALLAQPLRMEFLAGAIAQLQLQTPANDTLLLEGQITPEALYGPGMIMFLEVDARRLACRNPHSTQTTCLQVRELAFDEQGLRIPPPGPWKPFYDTIDGYTHVPGERNVLRVKRFERSNVAGATAPYLYVLDLVVETEKVAE
jgi:heat shock protein HslJ